MNDPRPGELSVEFRRATDRSPGGHLSDPAQVSVPDEPDATLATHAELQPSMDAEDWPGEGCRVGRYVVLRDVDGRRHAVAAGAVAAVGEIEEGALLLLPGGRMIQVPRAFPTVMRWLGA